MPWLSRLAAACFVLALPLLLVTTNVRILAGEPRFYERGFREHDSEIRTGLPLSELDEAARDIIAYFENDSAILRIIVDDNGEEVSLFNARETAHMQDVKSLIQTLFRVNEVSLAYVLTYITGVFLWAGAGSMRRLAVLALAGIGVGAVAVGTIGAFAITGFDSTWTKFHEVVFSNDLWQLNPATDRLIQMFPEPFWEEATFILAAMTAAEALLITMAALSYLVFSRRERAAPDKAEPIRVRPQRSREVPD